MRHYEWASESSMHSFTKNVVTGTYVGSIIFCFEENIITYYIILFIIKEWKRVISLNNPNVLSCILKCFVSSIFTCTRDFMWPGAVVIAAYLNASPF